ERHEALGVRLGRLVSKQGGQSAVLRAQADDGSVTGERFTSGVHVLDAPAGPPEIALATEAGRSAPKRPDSNRAHDRADRTYHGRSMPAGPSPVELSTDCPSCGLESGLVETYDALAAACRFGLPVSTKCKLCGLSHEAVFDRATARAMREIP